VFATDACPWHFELMDNSNQKLAGFAPKWYLELIGENGNDGAVDAGGNQRTFAAAQLMPGIQNVLTCSRTPLALVTSGTILFMLHSSIIPINHKLL
jgi:hypothetical protein